ncbi:hypothetical protein PM082_016659 [Marasmius tenuissimus]|nr:hypothetical protein PM082_016659 [Marasmius tenuissimus]
MGCSSHLDVTQFKSLSFSTHHRKPKSANTHLCSGPFSGYGVFATGGCLTVQRIRRTGGFAGATPMSSLRIFAGGGAP